MTQKETLRKVFGYVQHYIGYFMASVLLAIVTVVTTLSIPVLTGKAIDSMIGVGNVDMHAVFYVIFIIMILVGITALAQWLMSLCNNRMTYGIVRDIRRDAFEKIERLPLSYLDSHSHGDIVSRVISDVDILADGLLMGFTQFFTGIMTIIGTLLFMLHVHVRIALVVVLLTPLSFVVAGFIAKRTFVLFHQQSETRGRQTAYIDEMIGNQKVVQAFGYEEKAVQEFDSMNEQLEKESLSALFYSSITNPCTRFVNGLVYAIVGLLGAFTVISGGMTVGQLSCFLSYATQYTKPFNEISGVVTELQNALACARRIFDLLDEPEEESADNLSEDNMQEAQTKILKDVDGTVDLEKVYFSYTPEQKLIEDFNLHVKPGQRIAIIGPTGCGKTTVINLLMRFYDVRSGEIRVSGQPIREVTRHSLRSSYGMVLQDTWLKYGTIAENIAMGKPEATREEIIEAAKASHAHSFIKRLPDGYDTMVGENEGNLSQGQKQLLCIARVMLCLPPMLILDEATSSIDTRTEQKIQNAFSKMMEGRTSFIVAHRLSTIQNADRILVMKDGNIIEQGTHEELLALEGFYAKLYAAMG